MCGITLCGIYGGNLCSMVSYCGTLCCGIM